MRNDVPCGGVRADSASDVGTPRSVASNVKAQPLSVRATAARPARVTEWITNLPGSKRGRAAGCGAPLSYSVLHPDGSLEGNMRSNADDPARRAADLLGVIRNVQAEHPEPEVCTH